MPDPTPPIMLLPAILILAGVLFAGAMFAEPLFARGIVMFMPDKAKIAASAERQEQRIDLPCGWTMIVTTIPGGGGGK